MKKDMQLPSLGILLVLMSLQTLQGTLSEVTIGEKVHKIKQDHDTNKKIKGCKKRKRYQCVDINEAVYDRNLKSVKRFIELGVDLNRSDSQSVYNWVPLHRAAYNGDQEIVKVLLQGRAEVDKKNGVGWTPLHMAIWRGYKDIVELLLNGGADQAAITNLDNTPLHLAAVGGHQEIVEVLLKAKASVNSVTSFRWTPLHMAAWEGYKEIVKLLLKFGSDKAATTDLGDTPLHLASERNHEGLIRILLQANVDVNAQTKDGVTPLYKAARAGRTGATLLLIEAGANAQLGDKFGKTPLCCVLDAVLPWPECALIPYALLLKGNASLEDVDSFSLKAENLLKELSFDRRTFAGDLEKSKKLLQEQCDGFVHVTGPYSIPRVIAQLIFAYYDCIYTRILFFQKALLLNKPASS